MKMAVALFFVLFVLILAVVGNLCFRYVFVGEIEEEDPIWSDFQFPSKKAREATGYYNVLIPIFFCKR